MNYLFVVLILFFTNSTFSEVREEQRTWLGIFARKEMTHTDLWMESQLRRDDENQTMLQTLNRFGVLKNLSLEHEIGVLFAFVQTGLVKEYRPTLHHLYKKTLHQNHFILRNRLEFRDIENEDSDSLRFRSQIRWSYVLNSHFDFVVWDEYFLNLTNETWTGRRLFERNRAFVGTKFKWGKENIELGYINQYIPRRDQSLLEHIMTLYFFF